MKPTQDYSIPGDFSPARLPGFLERGILPELRINDKNDNRAAELLVAVAEADWGNTHDGIGTDFGRTNAFAGE